MQKKKIVWIVIRVVIYFKLDNIPITQSVFFMFCFNSVEVLPVEEILLNVTMDFSKRFCSEASRNPSSQNPPLSVNISLFTAVTLQSNFAFKYLPQKRK